MCGIGISSKGNYITNGFSAWANPGTSRFNSCRMGRVGNMHEQSDTNDNKDKYEQDRAEDKEFMFYLALCGRRHSGSSVGRPGFPFINLRKCLRILIILSLLRWNSSCVFLVTCK